MIKVRLTNVPLVSLGAAGLLAVHEAGQQEGGQGLLRDHQAAHGPGDDDHQD